MIGEGNIQDRGRAHPPARLGDIIGRDWAPTPIRDRRDVGEIPDAKPSGNRLGERRAEVEFYSELNLNRFPFASLFDKDTGKSLSIAVRQEIPAGETRSVFEWIVTPAAVKRDGEGLVTGGLPGPFDRKVFRALERIVLGRTLKRGEPLTNPQPVEIKEILETLGLTVQTRNYRSVQRALGRLKSTTVSCSGLVSAKGKAPATGTIFSPISELRWAGQTDPETGLRIDRTQVYFPKFYLDSVNTFDVRPVDWDLWLALGSRPLAQRLYEILEMKFFGLKDSAFVRYTYEELCQILPSHRQKKPADARRILDRAHEALRKVAVRRLGGDQEVRLLDRVEWQWDGSEAVIRYFPHRDYLARLRERRPPEFDPRALELAKEFDDMDSLPFYQLAVRRVDWQYVQAARAEVRSNSRVRDPRKYFSATLRKILSAVGAEVPFGDQEHQAG